MELELSQKIKKAESLKVSIPNFKSSCLLPTKLRLNVQELEFSLLSGNNTLVKYTEPYFRIYNEIDLSDFRAKINDGEDLSLAVKNLAKGELHLLITIIYEKQLGNIIYTNTYYDNQVNFEQCLTDIEIAGQLTQLIIDADSVIKSIILDPIYKLRKKIGNDKEPEDEGINEAEFSNWTSGLAIQNSKPSSRMVIDFTDTELRNYVKYLQFYKLKIVFVEEKLEKGEKVSPKMHVVCFGYKADKR